MGEKRQQSDLADIGALAGHVRTGDQGDLRCTIQLHVIRHKTLLGQALLQHRMTPVSYGKHPLVPHFGPAVVVKARRLSKGRQHVELGQGGGALLDWLEPGE